MLVKNIQWAWTDSQAIASVLGNQKTFTKKQLHDPPTVVGKYVLQLVRVKVEHVQHKLVTNKEAV
jgi:hypothetical protein